MGPNETMEGTVGDSRFKWRKGQKEYWCKTMVNCNNVISLGDNKNYVGGDATTNGRAKSHVYATISTSFGKFTMF